MHLELGPAHGIRIADVRPGFVSTELLDGDPDGRCANDRLRDYLARSRIVSEILVRPTD